MMLNSYCCMGGHYWNGTSQCVRCGARLRCICGVYVREDNIDEHCAERCRVLLAIPDVGKRENNDD